MSPDGKVAFNSLENDGNVYLVPLDPAEGAGLSQAKLTDETSEQTWADVARRAPSLTYVSNSEGNFDVWLKDLTTGESRNLTRSSQFEGSPVIRDDGSAIAYVERAEDSDVVNICIRAADGDIQRHPAPPTSRPQDWSPDGRYVLLDSGRVRDFGLKVLDTISGETLPVLANPNRPIKHGSFSPDGNWIVFSATGPAEALAARFDPTSPTRPEEWLAVSEQEDLARMPQFSPDGRWVVYGSVRDGHSCLWKQQVYPTTMQRVGVPEPVAHFHDFALEFRRYTEHMSVGDAGVALPLYQMSGQIWLSKLE